MARKEFAFTNLDYIMAYAKRWHADDADLGRFVQIFISNLCFLCVKSLRFLFGIISCQNV